MAPQHTATLTRASTQLNLSTTNESRALRGSRSPLSGDYYAVMEDSRATGNSYHACASILMSCFGESCRLALPPYGSHDCSTACSVVRMIGNYRRPACLYCLYALSSNNNSVQPRSLREMCVTAEATSVSHAGIQSKILPAVSDRKSCHRCYGPQQDVSILHQATLQATSQRHSCSIIYHTRSARTAV